MTYERFLKVVLTLQKQERILSDAYDMNIDLIEFVDPYHNIVSILIKEIYGEEGYEWFSWFCYESEYGQKDWSKHPSYKRNKEDVMELEYEAGEVRFGATDEEGNPICFDIESTYQYLEANYNK